MTNLITLAVLGPLGGVTKQRPNVLHAITMESGAQGCMKGQTLESACGKKRVFFVSDAEGSVLLWPPRAKGTMERCEECWVATGKKRPRRPRPGRAEMPAAEVAHEHNFEFEEWSYDDQRRYLICDCGVKVPDTRAEGR